MNETNYIGSGVGFMPSITHFAVNILRVNICTFKIDLSVIQAGLSREVVKLVLIKLSLINWPID